MRYYWPIFLGVLFIATWIADRSISSAIEKQLISRQRQQLSLLVTPLRDHLRKNKFQAKSSVELFRLINRVTSDRDRFLGIYHFDLIDEFGNVIATSDPQTDVTQLNNQDGKPEIINSRTHKSGFALRGHRAFYAAKFSDPDSQERFIRVNSLTLGIEQLVSYVSRIVWIIGAVAGVLGLVCLYLVSRRSLRPLEQFAIVARKIAGGDYNAMPPLRAQDGKWVTLADAIRHMQGELEKREQNTLENSSRLQAVLGSMIEGVLAIDAEGIIMLANDAACEMLQSSQDSVVGRQFDEIFRVPELATAIQATQRDGSFSKCEFQTRDLVRKVISARVSVLSEKKTGETPGIAVVLHDVTELRQLETMRRDFVANVSHELKTPLASIKAYAETLKLGAINDANKNMYFVENIEAQADLLNEQIQDLLQLARVESGQKNWEIAAVSINSICNSCIRQFASEAQVRNIAVHFNPIEEDQFVKADRDGVRTILSNLISNALHYTPEGGQIDIKISDLGSFIKIEVVDDGIGISIDHHARIFERFYRVDKARSREHGGTGLGLSIVKHLCQAFGGSVELESALGKGSRFIVKLPNANR